jgi:hypothetical protein
VYTEVPATTGIPSYGIFSSVATTFSTGSGPDYAGYFSGDVFTTASSYYTSDKNLKKDIKTIGNSMDIINKLNPVTYNFNTESNKTINLPKEKQYGFISQEVKEILPEFTKVGIEPAKFDKEGNEIASQKEILGLNYNGFIAILTKGIQEQQVQIETQKKINEEQQKQIEEMKSIIQSIVNNGSESKITNSQQVDLSDKNVIVLNQNVPNPFAESTVINYNVPNSFSKAQIMFTTSDGKVIKTIDITEKGEGRLNVFANDLSNGIYIYSLIIDGKMVETKKMMKQ